MHFVTGIKYKQAVTNVQTYMCSVYYIHIDTIAN